MSKQNLFFKSTLVVSISAIVLIVSCRKEAKTQSVLQTPELPQQPYHYNNWSDNEVALGRVLFYDKHLSANNSVACGTCHIQAFGFSDGKRLSPGVANKLTRRNTPSITNESSSNGLFWDNRATDFSDLVFRPITNHEEMGMIDLEKLPGKLKALGYYNKLFNDAYGSDVIQLETINRAMAAFLNALERGANTKYEKNSIGGKFADFNELELLGKEIYFSKGHCSSCHFIGRGWQSSANIGLDVNYTDKGMTHDAVGNTINQEGMFRIPTLINIEITAPYMHDGRFKTLEEVVEHYNSGIKDHKDLSWSLRDFTFDKNGMPIGSGSPRRLHLTDLEKKGLVAFLKTFSDWDYVKDIRFSDPFRK